MATTISLKNTVTGEIRPAPVGFSWTSLFFGFFVPMFRGDITYFFGILVLNVIVAFATLGIGNIVVWLFQGFTYNKRWIRLLSEKGFAPADEGARNTMKAHGLFFDAIAKPKQP